MYVTSTLSEAQRNAAVALFEQGFGYRAAASRLAVSRWPVRRLYRRWVIHGRGALVVRPMRQSYSFEFKLEVVRRAVAREASAAALAKEHGLSSGKLVETWVRAFREGGEDALCPKAKGRPAKDSTTSPPEPSELQRLRRENERLRAEVAYLGKVRALREQGRR